MSRIEKLVTRFYTIPSDFSWEELINVLAHFGYQEIRSGKTGGSRRKFSDKNKNIISLHKPHPANIVKEYALKQIIAKIKNNI